MKRALLAPVPLLMVMLLMPGEARGEQRLLSLSADAGFGTVGSVAHSTFHAGINVREGGLALSLFGRVRLALTGDAVIRGRDYDEASDYLHLLRHLRYARRFGDVNVEASFGEILGHSLGHGTLVRDYANIGDPDHLHSGARLSFRHQRLHIDAMVDNVLSPQVIASRMAVVPWSNLQRLRLGVSLVADPQAPTFIALDPRGRREIDEAFNLQGDHRVLVLTGFDAEMMWGNRRRSYLRPYGDLNTSWEGFGVHLGLSGGVPIGSVRVDGQLEYRMSSSGYSPDYMGTFYDVDRYQASLAFSDPRHATSAAIAPKATALREGVYGGHGVLAQLVFDAGSKANVKLGYRFHPGPDAHRAWIRLMSRPVKKLQVGALVVARGLGGPAPLSGLAAIAEGRYRFHRHIYGVVQLSRRWSVAPDNRYYGALTVFNMGLGSSWSR